MTAVPSLSFVVRIAIADAGEVMLGQERRVIAERLGLDVGLNVVG
jgi:hypothetical protein